MWPVHLCCVIVSLSVNMLFLKIKSGLFIIRLFSFQHPLDLLLADPAILSIASLYFVIPMRAAGCRLWLWRWWWWWNFELSRRDWLCSQVVSHLVYLSLLSFATNLSIIIITDLRFQKNIIGLFFFFFFLPKGQWNRPFTISLMMTVLYPISRDK